jgi:hypothetical protein
MAKNEDGPVLTMSMADEIEAAANEMLKPLIEGGPIPRPVILTIAIIALSKYTGKPVSLDVEK